MQLRVDFNTSGSIGTCESCWSSVSFPSVMTDAMLFWIINRSCCNSGIFITIKVLQTTAVFHSLHQRQDKALADQEQMIRIITTVDLSETEYKEVTAIKIPLLQQDRYFKEKTVFTLYLISES
jgi:hypothetical protein